MNQQIRNILTSLGFTQAKGQPMLYEKQIEDAIEYVDFRKKEHAEKGRRFVKKGDNFDIDPDTITDLVEFKRLRDEALQSSSTEHSEKQPPQNSDLVSRQKDKLKLGTPDNLQLSKDNPEDKSKREASSGKLGQETTLSVTIPSSLSGVQSPPAPVFNLYEFLYSLVGAGGIIEIFGDTGSLKTQLCVEVAKSAMASKKKIYYLDTEGKVGLKNKKDLGENYEYQPVWLTIQEKIMALPDADLVVVDSVGFPILTQYATMKANEQGDALLDLVAMVGNYLKTWAFKNKALVLITNQPKSEFLKSAEEIQRMNPFGDKMHFAVNLILRANKTIVPGSYDKINKRVVPPSSIGRFTSHRSPDFMDDILMFILEKTNDSVTVGVDVGVTKRLDEINGTKSVR